jgi:hypothetical protein
MFINYESKYYHQPHTACHPEQRMFPDNSQRIAKGFVNNSDVGQFDCFDRLLTQRIL